MEHTDGEVWDKEYKDTFFGDPKKAAAQNGLAQAKLAPAVKGQAGSLNITPKESKPVTDLSQFLGRAGSAGRTDPNKAAIAAKAKAKTTLRIAPDEGGNLTVEGAPDPADG